MSIEFKTRLLQAFDEGWNRDNPEAMYQLCSNNFRHHRPPYPDLIGLAAEEQDIENTHKVFSNIRFTIHELIMEENTAVMRWTWKASHTGQSTDIPITPEGLEVSMEGCSILHLEDGKIIDEWEFADNLGLLTLLGVISS